MSTATLTRLPVIGPRIAAAAARRAFTTASRQSPAEFLAANGLTDAWTRPAPTAQQFVAAHDPNTPWTPADYDTELNLALNATGTEV